MISAHVPSAGNCGASSITPEKALIISRIAHSPCGVNAVVAEHDLYVDAQGQCRMGSGALIGPERLADITDELSETATRRTDDCFLPANVLAHGADTVAWHVPGRRRPMFFSTQAGSFCLHVAWPNLLFVARGRKLVLAAIDRDGRPDADTPVYHAPLMNHSTDHGLCFGSVAMPARAAVDTRQGFEAAVFESYFSHTNGANNLRYGKRQKAEQHGCDATHVALWRSVEKRQLKRFPKRHLLPLDMTVSDLLKYTGSKR